MHIRRWKRTIFISVYTKSSKMNIFLPLSCCLDSTNLELSKSVKNVSLSQIFKVEVEASVEYKEVEAIQCFIMGSSTETATFQVYKILKIDHEFLQFF